MAREKQPELGVKSPYDARYGVTVGRCRGLDLAHDPSTIADEALVDATNVRVHDGIVLSRPGQYAPLNSPAADGCIQALVDVNGGGPRFFLAQERTDTLAGFSDVDMLDRSQAAASMYVRVTDPPTAQRIQAQPREGIAESGTDVDDERARYVYQWWNDQIIFGGTDDRLWRFLIPEDDFSVDGVQVAELLKLQVPGEGSAFEISSMVTLPSTNSSAGDHPEFGPPLYFGTVGGGVVAYVNGRLVRLQAEGTFASRVLVFRYHDRLYGVGRQELRVQAGLTSGDSPTSTTWSNVALPGGITDLVAMATLEWDNYGYIAGANAPAYPTANPGDGKILRIDDSSGAPVVSVANSGAGGYQSFDDLALALGQAFVSYRYTPAATQKADVSPLSVSGTVGAPVGIAWAEDGMVPRILGTGGAALYISAWATGNTSLGAGPVNAIYEWDGTTLVKIADVVDSPIGTPFDMVTF